MKQQDIAITLNNIISQLQALLNEITPQKLNGKPILPASQPLIDEELASKAQAKMLFALAKANKVEQGMLQIALSKYGVTSGWTGDIPAKYVNALKKDLETLGMQMAMEEMLMAEVSQ